MATGHPEPIPKQGFLRNQHKIGLPFPNKDLGPTELPILCRCTMNSKLEFLVRHEIDIHTLQTNGSFGTSNTSGGKKIESKLQEDRINGEELSLLPEEVIFLTFGVGCLSVQNEATGETLSHNQIWKLLVEKNQEFPFFYCVYHYFRSKNWVPKPATKYGGDYVLYKVGPGFYHSTYIVHITGLPSRNKMNWTEVYSLQRLASTIGKHALICQIAPPDNFSTENSCPSSIFDIQVKETVISRWNPNGRSEMDEDY